MLASALRHELQSSRAGAAQRLRLSVTIPRTGCCNTAKDGGSNCRLSMTTTILKLPNDVGRAIVESGAVFCCPLLGTHAFIRYASDRGVDITRERLGLLERLQLFAPVFRVKTPPDEVSNLLSPPIPRTIGLSMAGLGIRQTPMQHMKYPHSMTKTAKVTIRFFNLTSWASS